MILHQSLLSKNLGFSLILLLAPASALAQIPNHISHQGRVTVNGVTYSGTGFFKFLLFSDSDGNHANGNETAIWSNQTTNPSSMAAPTFTIGLDVEKGLYLARLGSPDMSALPTSIAPGVGKTLYLRTWFSPYGSGTEQLSPDTPIGAVPFALLASQTVSGLAGDLDASGHDITNLGNLELGTSGTNVDFSLRDGSGLTEMVIAANDFSGGPFLALYGEGVDLGTSTSADRTFELVGDESGGGSKILMRNGSGKQTVEIDASEGSGNSAIRLWNSGDAAAEVEILSSQSGNSRIIVDLLELRGADLSENFNVRQDQAEENIKAGVVVSIDPDNPGRLKVTDEAYDSKVAGITSGADGIRPGIVMGQPDTIADGKHAVAMTGRVWVDATAENGPIVPGDLITSSSIRGHAMKASDPTRSFGAVLGKAMTGLTEGQGRVLILVNLQ